jgi:hypothetical protein
MQKECPGMVAFPAILHRTPIRGLVVALAALMLLAPALTRTPSADASAGWCFDDPVILINGRPVSITNGILGDPTDIRAHVTSANTEVHLPKGVTASVVSFTSNFFHEPVTFIYDRGTWTPGKRVDVSIKVSFTSTKDYKVSSDIVTPTTTIHSQATANGSMSKQFFLN